LTIEMQAMFLEALAARHQDVLARLRLLAENGQVELASFHYADQLFIAFPYDDWKSSVDLTHELFDFHEMPLSDVVFCQEGQAAEGMAARMAEEGYGIMAWPVNLWEFQHGDFQAAPYYQFGDVKAVVAGKGVADDAHEVYVNWSFLGDGELMATGDWDPYFPWFFHTRDEAVQEYEDGLQAMADQGYVIGGIGEYVAALEDAGIAPTAAPRLLDGTWQPDSTAGVSMWLGRGGLWRKSERDNHVRTLNAMAHREIEAAETMAAAAGLDRPVEIDEAWRQLAIGETSDGSGINPYRGETEFSIASSAEAIRLARDVIDEGKASLQLERALVDTSTGEVVEGEFAWTGDPVDEGPVEVAVYGKKRYDESRWFKVSEDPPTWRLEIAFSDSRNKKARELYAVFPLTGPKILTTTALDDERVQAYPWADFVFPYYYLPAPIGLIGLGDNLWVIKDMANVHVAARIEPGVSGVRFEDLTAPWFETITWIFYLVQGSAEDALALADRVNVHPVLGR
jgi:hypothetical protein